jgi:hypothetical protein
MREGSEPARLTVVGASDLERRLLDAAGRERPSDEMHRRMRAALGLSVAGTAVATAAVAKAGTSAGLSAWLPAGIVAAVVTGGVVATLVVARTPTAEREVGKRAPAVVQSAPANAIAAPVQHTAARPAAAPARRHAATPDLRGEIALIDAARSAIRASAPERALSLLDHHRRSYTHGAFAPEAAVLRIEALEAAGRTGEARSLARGFLAKHPDSPLSDRVARIASRR